MAGFLDALKRLFGKKETETGTAVNQAADSAGTAAENVQEAAAQVQNGAENAAAQAQEHTENIVENVKDKVEDMVESVKDKLPDVSGFLDSILGNLPIDGVLGERVNEVIGSVRSAAPEDAGAADIAQRIIEALKTRFSLEGEIGEKIQAVIEFIKSKIPV